MACLEWFIGLYSFKRWWVILKIISIELKDSNYTVYYNRRYVSQALAKQKIILFNLWIFPSKSTEWSACEYCDFLIALNSYWNCGFNFVQRLIHLLVRECSMTSTISKKYHNTVNPELCPYDFLHRLNLSWWAIPCFHLVPRKLQYYLFISN